MDTRYPVAALLLTAACAQRNPLYCDADNLCTDPATPYCDIDADYPASDGIRNTCIPTPWDAGGLSPDAAACSTSTEPSCDGDSSVSCVDGHVTSVACPMGCSADTGACLSIVPSNDLGLFLDDAANGPDIQWDADKVAHVDTGDGSVSYDGTHPEVPSVLLAAPMGGVPVRVLLVRSFDIGGLSVASSGESTALAVLATGPITLRGRLQISFDNPTRDNGSVDSDSACGVRTGSTVMLDGQQIAGPAGGGHNGLGGRGGSITGAVSGPQGGRSFDNPDLVPLRGGCSGGGGSGGGGAIQLTSATAIVLESEAEIDAGGGGGGVADQGEATASQGGGAGGGILLEAPTVHLKAGAAIGANGGGGSCGTSVGANGQLSTLPALGGSCPDGVSRGGTGGALNTPASSGLTVPYLAGTSRRAGAGGGAAGYIRINTRSGNFESGPSVVVSPAPSTEKSPAQ